MSDTIDIAAAHSALEDLRARRPLVQNITNYVAMTVSANVLLALGASPAMVHAVEEVEDFVAIANALVINIGTLSPRWVEAKRLAARKAVSLGKPWVLDPVGCGATSYRTAVSAELSALKPTVIRGNASEIMSLAGAAGARPKGVDSMAKSEDAVAAARGLAATTGAVVCVTGEIDYATDGDTVIAIEGGDRLMPLSTALGCALSATVSAFTALRPPLESAAIGLAVFGAAGAEAASRCRGPGHLPAEICDALYLMDAAMLAKRARIRTPEMA
jgi:hydroxyethylthiazole kinase